MAFTLQDLASLLSEMDLRPLLNAEATHLQVGYYGLTGPHRLALWIDGDVLRVCTVGYSCCPATYPHARAVLELLAGLNCRMCLVRFGWEEQHGEIVMGMDLMLMGDGAPRNLVAGLLDNFMHVADVQYWRIRQTLRSGKDPGPLAPEAIIDEQLADPATEPGHAEMLKEWKERQLAEQGPATI